jgi:DNA-binding response OmpR family regulator
MVLVVDDDPVFRATLSEALTIAGFRVASAGNGLQALQCVEEERPDLVLLDMEMPAFDGRWFAEAVQRRGWQVPIVLMTARDRVDRLAQEIGATAFIAKPFEMNRLVGQLRALLTAC